MLFAKDNFTKHHEQLLRIIATAEQQIAKAESNDDGKILSQGNKNLEIASEHLKVMYNEILANKAVWDETILQKRKGDYENMVTRYKSIQQLAESLDSKQGYSP